MKSDPKDSKKQAHTSPSPYCFMDVVAGEAEEYARGHTSPLSGLLEEIENFSLTATPYPSMLTGRVEGRFLQLIVQLSGARRIVDIGTFTGYSALAMAEALSGEGRILTIERDLHFAKIAQGFFDRSPAGAQIALRTGEALEILRSLPDEQTDLVFIDADKQGYAAYYRESMRILKTGGLLLTDNVLWYGRIFHPKDDDSRAIADFNELVNADSAAERLFLTIRDGIYLIRKRAA
ncbi:MAG: class I SAM-dependent methyltransferase [Syntrophobacteraceae bacterium]|nr:class I SAM-dependent methyltransferase [Syntrophobacteraceae bacterium]